MLPRGITGLLLEAKVLGGKEEMLNSDSCSNVQSGRSWDLHPGLCIKTVSVSKVHSKEASIKADFTALTKSCVLSEHTKELRPFWKECSIFALEEMQITEKGKEKYKPFPTHSKTISNAFSHCLYSSPWKISVTLSISAKPTKSQRP